MIPAAVAAIWCALLWTADESPDQRLQILFLGDRGHHQPAERAHRILAPLAELGIDLFYTERMDDLNPIRLAGYDGLLLYANHLSISAEQEQALLQFVEGGKGFIPIHCASACFPDSERFVALLGAQFERHGLEHFSTRRLLPEHPILAGLGPHASEDESYVHRRHNPEGRTVLATRDEQGRSEPWTWIRRQGQGRVFYTAWGHDQRTWDQAWFLELLARGIRWSCGDDQPGAERPVAPFEYQPAEVPNYVPGSQGRLSVMQRPLSPAESLRRLIVPPEFRVELFAAEPDIRKPIALAFDQRGRLWIAETIDYPNQLQPEGSGRDTLKICEDTDGDGRADRFTIFAEQLSIPTSLVFANGGVIVSQAPDMLFLKDNDGDDVADERRVLFSGFGTADTHAGPSNLRNGFDNWIWGTVGYSGFDGLVGGERLTFRQGLFRFLPDGSRLEYLAATTNNTWGLGFSEDGFAFGSTANGNPSVFLAIPNRTFEQVVGFASGALQTIAESARIHPVTSKVRQVDWHGQFTAAAGHSLYTARAFPREYWNRVALVSAPTGHLLHRFVLERQGSDFIARDGWNLLASDDEWVAPIAAEVGPDGAVWCIDWYNFIVQHNPTPQGFQTGRGNAYETPLRDKRHGRIYRIVPREARLPEPLDLGSAAPDELVSALDSDNLLWRLTAQRLLVERGANAVQAALVRQLLLRKLKDQSVDELSLNPGALHALWTLAGLGLLTADADPEVRQAQLESLRHPASAVRRAAVSLLPANQASLDVLLDQQLLWDPDAGVRLASLLALTELPPSLVAGRAIFEVLSQPDNLNDRHIPQAATAAAARHAAGFLKSVLAGSPAEPKEEAAGASAPLFNNGSFEEGLDGTPLEWSIRHYGGQARHTWSLDGALGERSLAIASDSGADSSWFASVRVEPETTYRLSGKIRTQKLVPLGGAFGALLNVHELQGQEPVRTQAVVGDSDWTEVSVLFDSQAYRELSINCLFGGWGHATGQAWFDDLRLEQVGRRILPGRLGQVVFQVTRDFAARADGSSVVETLLALRGTSPELAEAFLDGVLLGWPPQRRVPLDAADRASLLVLLGLLSDGPRSKLLLLMARLGLERSLSADLAALEVELLRRLRDPAATADRRTSAAERLLALRDSTESVQAILDQIGPGTDLHLAVGLIGALAGSGLEETGGLLVRHWSALTPGMRPPALGVLSRRVAWSRALLVAVQADRIGLNSLSEERWSQFEHHPEPEIAALAREARGRFLDRSRESVVAGFMKLSGLRGDPSRGAQLYSIHCAACHRFDGRGGRIGPPLDGIGVRPREELIVAVLDPNRSVEENYRLYTLSTRDGQFLSGRLEAETRSTIELLDLGGQSHVVTRDRVDQLIALPVSLMPASFEMLGEQGLTDLLEYLRTGP